MAFRNRGDSASNKPDERSTAALSFGSYEKERQVYEGQDFNYLVTFTRGSLQIKISNDCAIMQINLKKECEISYSAKICFHSFQLQSIRPDSLHECGQNLAEGRVAIW